MADGWRCPTCGEPRESCQAQQEIELMHAAEARKNAKKENTK